MIPTEDQLSLRDAADALGISEVTARRWVKIGKLKAYQPGRKYLIPASAVETLLEGSQAGKGSMPSAEAAERRANLDMWTQTFRVLAEQKRAAIADLQQRTEAGGGSPDAWAALCFGAQSAYTTGTRLFESVSQAEAEGARLHDALEELGDVVGEITRAYAAEADGADVIDFAQKLSELKAS